MRFSKKFKKILLDRKDLSSILDEFEVKLCSIKRIKDFNKYPTRTIKGFIDYERDRICIEKSLPKEEKEITILHELLHEFYDDRDLARNDYAVEKETMKIWWSKKYN